MFYNAEHNQYVNEGAAFTLGDVQYPANWLNNATADEKAEAGLVEVTVVGAPGDDRYYWVSETLEAGVLTYTNTPKDLDSLKANAVAQANDTAHTILSPTDWMAVKAFETSTPMSAAWSQYRADVRAVANTARAAIEAATDIETLIEACKINWPNDPNNVVLEAAE